MSWAAVAGAAVTTVGGMMGGGEQTTEQEPWKPIRPYIKGKGPVPDYIAGNPLINTNWLDYITQLGAGGGGWDAAWQPPFATSPHFNPNQTFTPGPPGEGYPYGTPSGPNGPPPPSAPPPNPGQGGAGGGAYYSPGIGGMLSGGMEGVFQNGDTGGSGSGLIRMTDGSYYAPNGPVGGIFGHLGTPTPGNWGGEI